MGPRSTAWPPSAHLWMGQPGFLPDSFIHRGLGRKQVVHLDQNVAEDRKPHLRRVTGAATPPSSDPLRQPYKSSARRHDHTNPWLLAPITAPSQGGL